MWVFWGMWLFYGILLNVWVRVDWGRVIWIWFLLKCSGWGIWWYNGWVGVMFWFLWGVL